MLNAENIILLEKRWLKYKLKQKAKTISIVISIPLIGTLFFLFQNNFDFNTYDTSKQLEIKQKAQKEPIAIEKTNHIIVPKTQENKIKPKTIIEEKNIASVSIQNPSQLKEEVPTSPAVSNNQVEIVSTPMEKKVAPTSSTVELVTSTKKLKPYHLKLLPTLKGNDLFSSTNKLQLNQPKIDVKKIPPTSTERKIKKIAKNNPTIKKNKNLEIKISTTEVDTIKYLKEKFYGTENIVFAIMLCEEYYMQQNYKESIKWALTANEIDSRNDKSWYWFAKNKVKLGEKADAIKAIETFLSTNSSRRLTDLLKQLKYGDI